MAGVKGGKGAPPAPRAADRGKGKGETKSWQRKKAVEFEPVSLPSLPRGSLQDHPRWETAFAALSSEAGAAGVIFVATYAGVFVVKSSAQPAQEYFASTALRRLRVPAPPVRVVAWPCPEFKILKDAIRASATQMKMRGDISGGQRVQWRLGPRSQGRPQLLVMGLVPCSRALEGHPLAAELLEVENRPAGHTAAAVERLRAMGRCLGADVLLNNTDRVPSHCWDNEGNGGNLLLPDAADELDGSPAKCNTSGAGLVAIDNMLTCIKTDSAYCAANLEKYKERAQNFLEGVAAATDDVGLEKVFAQTRAFVYANTGVMLSFRALAEIRVGVLQSIAVVSAPSSAEELAFPEWVQEEKERVATKMVTHDWSPGTGLGVWAESAATIDVSFLKVMTKVFLDVAAAHPNALPPPPARLLECEAVQDIREETFGMRPELWRRLPPNLREELQARTEGKYNVDDCFAKPGGKGNVAAAKSYGGYDVAGAAQVLPLVPSSSPARSHAEGKAFP